MEPEGYLFVSSSCRIVQKLHELPRRPSQTKLSALYRRRWKNDILDEEFRVEGGPQLKSQRLGNHTSPVEVHEPADGGRRTTILTDPARVMVEKVSADREAGEARKEAAGREGEKI
jgi:hypothetical protein